MKRIVARAKTNNNLFGAGGREVPTYLKTAFPNVDTASPVPAAISTTTPATSNPTATTHAGGGVEAKGFVESAEETINDILHHHRSGDREAPDALEQDSSDLEDYIEVPFYIKIRGKGKGRPVMYDVGKSAVSQIYGTSINPSPTRMCICICIGAYIPDCR